MRSFEFHNITFIIFLDESSIIDGSFLKLRVQFLLPAKED